MEKIHLLITRRRAVWRVRVFFRGAILWKSYRVAEYPTPEAVGMKTTSMTSPTATARKKLLSIAYLFVFGGSIGGR